MLILLTLFLSLTLGIGALEGISELPSLQSYDAFSKTIEQMKSPFGASDQCFNQIYYFYKLFSNSSHMESSSGDLMILLELVDAWGKPEAGLLLGNTYWVGQPSLCNRLEFTGSEDTEGSFGTVDSLLDVTLNSTSGSFGGGLPGQTSLEIWIGMCLPRSCDRTQILGIASLAVPIINKNLSTYGVSIELKDVVMHADGEYNAGFWIGTVIFGALVAIVCFATSCDYMIQEIRKVRRAQNAYVSLEEDGPDETHDKPEDNYLLELSQRLPSKIVLAFSLKTNISKLLSCETRSDNVACLNGIRVLSIGWVVLGHTLFFLAIFYPGMNADNVVDYLNKYSNKWTFLAISNATFSVDSFFVLSGFLITYLLIPKIESHRWIPSLNELKTMGLGVLKRYIRLTIPMALVMLFVVSFWKILGNDTSASWQPELLEAQTCEENFWVNLLYLNNFIGLHKPCIGWVWYLANDFQMSLYAILIMAFYARKPMLAYAITGFSVLVSIVVSFSYSFHENLGPLTAGIINLKSAEHYNSNMDINFNQFYIKPWFRFGAYGMGMILAFYMRKYPHRPMPGRVRYSLVMLMWVLALGTLAAVIYGLAGLQNGNFPSRGMSAVYNGLCRPAWALGLCWIIFACVRGYGGVINTFLSWSLWVPLARLTYLVYLLHPLVIQYLIATSKMKLHYTNVNYSSAFIVNLVYSYALSFIFVLLVESPVINLEKLVKW